MLASVIICTHNRASFVGRCLRALRPEPGSPDDWEVLVVANACADDTVQRANSEAPHFGPRLRVVVEPTPGLSIARNTGAAAARGRFVVYLDDDAIPCAGWVEAYRRYFLRNPGVRGGGGPIDPDWGDLRKPSYWRPEFDVNRASLRLPDHTEHFPDDSVPFGANMFMALDALREIGGFDPALGMTGKRLGLAEETEWFLRLRKTGARLGYVADAPVSHWVNPRDITRSGLLRRAFLAGVISVRIFGVQRPSCGWTGWLRHTVSATLRGRLHMGEQVYLMLELGRLWAHARPGAGQPVRSA